MGDKAVRLKGQTHQCHTIADIKGQPERSWRKIVSCGTCDSNLFVLEIREAEQHMMSFLIPGTRANGGVAPTSSKVKKKTRNNNNNRHNTSKATHLSNVRFLPVNDIYSFVVCPVSKYIERKKELQSCHTAKPSLCCLNGKAFAFMDQAGKRRQRPP